MVPICADEHKLIEQSIQGDDDAFQEIVSAYQGAVFNLCWRMLGDAQRAEDAAQETFLKVFKHLDLYEPDRKFLNWILTIASNHCIDCLRRRRIKTTTLEVAQHKLAFQQDDFNPENRLIGREREELVAELLAELKPEDRSAIVLFYWFDYSQREIARALFTTESAIKCRMHRSRKTLAVRLREFRSASSNDRKPRTYVEPRTMPPANSLAGAVDATRLEQAHV